MEVAVLGPVQVRRGPDSVALGTRKQRELLAALALHAGRPVPVDTLVDLLWADAPPPGVSATLQSYVAGLRRALEPQRERRAPASVLVTVDSGYALRLPAQALDATRFDQLVTEQHHRVGADPSAEELAELVDRLDEALALWRGDPYAELEDAPAAEAERTRLGELRLLALEDRAVAELARGHHSTVAGQLEALTAAHPLRERLWALRALALTRSGRQAEALEVLREIRTLLVEELGLEPGHELRKLQGAILAQDPGLDWTPPPSGVATRGPSAPGPVPAADARSLPGPAGPGAVAPTTPTGPTTPTTPTAPNGAAGGAGPNFWPMVGRSAELAVLAGLLDTADTGRPAFAAVTGDPGIGKTRLTSELAALARARGATVLVGSCSQDDGAPPLWPWRPVLAGLGAELPRAAPGDREDEGAQFRSWEAVVATIHEAAAQRPLLLVLDDLHWADRSSLRVLRLLVETVQEGRLAVVGTWRPHPPPREALADVAESLARRHALRLELTGLDAAGAAEVVTAVTHDRPSAVEAESLALRTDGNPFFLVEYARLAAEGGDLAALLAEPDPPTAVHDVLVRRIERLEEPTRAVLRTASVVGREFDTGTVAAAGGLDEDDVLDLLEPARVAGLVREDGVDRWAFAHALVRDTVYAALPATRRARVHVRVAEALEGRGRETEQARHWLEAGPGHAARAWPSAAAAAAATRRLHAHDESAELLVAALEAQQRDPAATDVDRWELLMQLIDARRWSGHWQAVVDVEVEAVALAERLGDDDRVAAAATAMTLSLWSSAPFGQVNEVVVGALRRCLARLPGGDSRSRCLVLLGLANELYFTADFDQRRSWIAEAVAMARRIGEPGLLLDALMVAQIALFVPATAADRLVWLSEAVALAEASGDERRLAVAATLRAVVVGELGRVEELGPALTLAQREATRLRHQYALVILAATEVPWLAMAGRFEECEDRLERMQRLMQLMGLVEGENLLTVVSLALWRGTPLAVVDELVAVVEAETLLGPLAVVCLLRGGEVDRARTMAEKHPFELDADTWASPLLWGCAAETALGLGDAVLGRRAYAALAPYAGRALTAGAHCALGPVDAFLALAAAAGGEGDAATRHADRAEQLVEQWQIPLAGDWLRELRGRHQF
ncbi:BTAD domain-containing putative transcriptional regulator [Nocardioides mesophilus]|uniref:AAA family ATPase n=1 Tax=Nocardioides mesophilus TaxID=433659 RepID=A0A7G9R8X8_9ACTN|nr:BTAD domain-containing putative transcriptional regulator [Nocardioides mesophilus]QNN52053.1 AAA family ATPase [Nocardioides mesophilus]